MKNYFSTSVLVNGYLYGFNNTKLTCLDFRTGKTKWKTGGFNRGSLIAADGKLIIYGDQGLLALAEISPKSYKELAKFNSATNEPGPCPRSLAVGCFCGTRRS